MNYAAGNDVRRSIMSTLHVLQHNSHRFYTINELSVEMQKLTGVYNLPHRRQIYRNVNSLKDFGFPIITEVGRSNEHKFKWDDSKVNDRRKIDFAERVSEYALSRVKQGEDELEEYS